MSSDTLHANRFVQDWLASREVTLSGLDGQPDPFLLKQQNNFRQGLEQIRRALEMLGAIRDQPMDPALAERRIDKIVSQDLYPGYNLVNHAMMDGMKGFEIRQRRLFKAALPESWVQDNAGVIELIHTAYEATAPEVVEILMIISGPSVYRD
jgi:hypothetical protein